MKKNNKTHPRQSWTFDEYTNSEIRRAASTGIYDIRGGGSKRKLPHFDDLLFLGAFLFLPALIFGVKCLLKNDIISSEGFKSLPHKSFSRRFAPK